MLAAINLRNTAMCVANLSDQWISQLMEIQVASISRMQILNINLRMVTPLKIRTVSFAEITTSGITTATQQPLRYRDWSSIRTKSQSTIEQLKCSTLTSYNSNQHLKRNSLNNVRLLAAAKLRIRSAVPIKKPNQFTVLPLQPEINYKCFPTRTANLRWARESPKLVPESDVIKGIKEQLKRDAEARYYNQHHVYSSSRELKKAKSAKPKFLMSSRRKTADNPETIKKHVSNSPLLLERAGGALCPWEKEFGEEDINSQEMF